MPPSPPARLPRPNPLAVAEGRLADRLAEQHLSRMTRVSDVDAHATRTWRWVIVLGVLPVHLTTLLLTAGGLWLSLVGPPLTERGLGVLLLAAVYVARPRINKRPRYVAELTRVEAPRLFGLVTEVARVTDTAVPAEVLVLPDFNAFATQVGWRRTRVVGIGAPLWMACSSQQRVALLGHELSHFANKDTSYGLWVATALETLRGWYFTLNQRDSLSRGGERLIQMVLLKPVAALIAGHRVSGRSTLPTSALPGPRAPMPPSRCSTCSSPTRRCRRPSPAPRSASPVRTCGR